MVKQLNDNSWDTISAVPTTIFGFSLKSLISVR